MHNIKVTKIPKILFTTGSSFPRIQDALMNGQLIPFRILYAGNWENQKEDTADSLLFLLIINYFPDRISFYLFSYRYIFDNSQKTSTTRIKNKQPYERSYFFENNIHEISFA